VTWFWRWVGVISAACPARSLLFISLAQAMHGSRRQRPTIVPLVLSSPEGLSVGERGVTVQGVNRIGACANVSELTCLRTPLA